MAFTLIGLFDGMPTVLDPTPTSEDRAIAEAVYCAEDWDRVLVVLGGSTLGHAKVPANRSHGAAWYPASGPDA